MGVEMLPLIKADGMGKAYSCPSVFSPIHGLQQEMTLKTKPTKMAELRLRGSWVPTGQEASITTLYCFYERKK